LNPPPCHVTLEGVQRAARRGVLERVGTAGMDDPHRRRSPGGPRKNAGAIASSPHCLPIWPHAHRGGSSLATRHRNRASLDTGAQGGHPLERTRLVALVSYHALRSIAGEPDPPRQFKSAYCQTGGTRRDPPTLFPPPHGSCAPPGTTQRSSRGWEGFRQEGVTDFCR
jgi:hypothetical protein